MAWFWGRPIVYPFGQVAPTAGQSRSIIWLKYVYLANPIAPIAMTFQRAIYNRTKYAPRRLGQGPPVSPHAPHLGVRLVRHDARHRLRRQRRSSSSSRWSCSAGSRATSPRSSEP